MDNKTNITDYSNCFSQELLLKYINNELSNEENLAVENHIKDCEMCSDIMDGLLLMENPNEINNIAASLNVDIDLKIKKKKKILGMNITAFRAVAAIFLLLLISGSYILLNNMFTNVQIDEIKEFSQLEQMTFEESEDNRQVADAVSEKSPSGIDDNKYAEQKKIRTIDEYFEEEQSIADKTIIKKIELDEIGIIEEVSDTKTNSRYLAEGNKDSNAIGRSSVKSETGLLNDRAIKEDTPINNQATDITASIANNADSGTSHKQGEKHGNGNRSLLKSKEPVSAEKLDNDQQNIISQTPTEHEMVIEELIIVESDNINSIISDEVNTPITLAFASVEQKPEFPGGDSALMKYIVENFEYPDVPTKNSTQSKIYVQFVIDKSGKVTDVELLRGIEPFLDNEALRVVKTMPDWIPGKQNGKPVAVVFVVPLNINLR